LWTTALQNERERPDITVASSVTLHHTGGPALADLCDLRRRVLIDRPVGRNIGKKIERKRAIKREIHPRGALERVLHYGGTSE
jgi:hypothetical protein